MKLITLGSGNKFYYQEKENFIPMALVASVEGEFLGAYAGKEATFQFNLLSKGKEVIDTDENILSVFKSLDKKKFSKKLGRFAKYLTDFGCIEFNDLDDCDGTGSNAASCDSRLNYYQVVGLKDMFKTGLNCYIFAFIANHLSFFGAKNFEKTFYQSQNKDTSFYFDAYFKKLENGKFVFKKKLRKKVSKYGYIISYMYPAYYVVSLVRNKR